MSSPLVTVIMVSYNQGRYVEKTLESIRAQTYGHTQFIIVDDYSKDNSVEIIKKWLLQNQIECRLILHAKNEGICRALNDAISVAEGKYISMIAADDTWKPNKISNQVDIMERLPEKVGLVYSDAFQMDENGQLLPKQFLEAHGINQAPSGKIFLKLWEDNFIPAMTTLIRKSCYDSIGIYDESLSFEDYDMWLRMACSFEFAFSPEISASYRIVSTSMIRTRKKSIDRSGIIIRLKFMELDESLNTPEAVFELGRNLYAIKHPKRHRYLWRSFKLVRSPNNFIHFICSLVSIPIGMVPTRDRLRKLSSMLQQPLRGIFFKLL